MSAVPPECGSRISGLGRCESGCELGTAIERVGAFAGLGLDEFGDDGDPLSFGEALDGRACLDTERRALPPRPRCGVREAW